MSQAIYVPMHLEAFVVAGALGVRDIRDDSLRFEVLNRPDLYQQLGMFLEPGTVSGAAHSVYAHGIHLHWVMPAAYRHGASGDADGFGLPLAPNRWLVVRTSSGAAEGDLKAALHPVAWLVESDVVVDEGPLNWVEEEPPGSKRLRAIRIGRRSVLEPGAQVPGGRRVPLTVVQPGNVGFAASYLHCRGVFGLHDEMEGVNPRAGLRFSYRVLGWHQEAEEDLLAGLSGQALLDRLLALRWELGEDALKTILDAGEGLGVVCHASVYDVVWEDRPPRLPNASDLRVALGNSTDQAFATLLKDAGTGAAALGTRFLQAYQQRQLQDSGMAQGLAQARELPLGQLRRQLHARDFHALGGGTRHVLRQRGQAADSATPTQPFPALVADTLRHLNQVHAAAFQAQSEREDLAEHLHALAHKLLAQWTVFFAGNTATAALLAPGGPLERAIEAAAGQIAALESRIHTLQSDAQRIRTTLTDALAQWPRLADMELLEVPAEPYFIPREPGLLVEGLAPTFSYPTHAEGQRQGLPCRLASQLVAGMRLQAGSDSFTWLPEEHLPSLMHLPQGLRLRDALPPILMESLLLDPLAAPWINEAVREQAGLSVLRLEDVIRALQAGQPGQGTLLDADSQQALRPEAGSVRAWQAPWVPLHLEWELEWEAAGTEAGPDGAIRHWGFAGGAYAWQGTHDGERHHRYSGRTSLIADFQDRAAQLNALARRVMPEGAQPLEEVVPMAFSLHGLHGQFLQRRVSRHLPLVAPVVRGLSTGRMVQLEDLLRQAENAVGGRRRWIPHTGAAGQALGFFGVRAGTVHLRRLAVVDAFGQELVLLDASRAALPRGGGLLRPAFAPGVGEGALLLPPRLCQAARLRWEWMQAARPGAPSDSDPGSSPVLAWLIADGAAGHLHILHGTGGMLGTMVVAEELVAWRPAGQASPEARLEGFVSRLVAEGAAAFRALLRQVEAVQAKLGTGLRTGLPAPVLPLAHPVALAHARCSLELLGRPALRQDWTALPAHDAAPELWAGIRFPVMLGNEAAPTDGLVGYFVDGAWDRMHGPGGPGQEPALALRVGESREVMVLMDPREGLELASGILPWQRHVLPAHAIRGGLMNLQLRFFAGPLLARVQGKGLDFGLRLRAFEGMEWAWEPALGAPGETWAMQGGDAVPWDFSGVEAVEGHFHLRPARPEDQQSNT